MGWFSKTPKPDPLDEHFRRLDAARTVLARERLAIIRRIPVADKERQVRSDSAVRAMVGGGEALWSGDRPTV